MPNRGPVHIEPSDEELLNGMVIGDYLAFTRMYEKYVKNLTSYGLKFTTDIQLVEDCLHDLFVWLWNKRQQLPITHSLKSYLIKSVRTAVLQRIKRNHKQVAFENDDEADYPFELSLSSEQQYINAERQALLKQQVAHLLSLLTPKQKEVVYLRFYEGLSFDDIAQNMDLSVKACYKLMGRAIMELRKAFPYTWMAFLCLLK